MKRNILGIDLGTTSIGFAHIIEGKKPEESSIVQLGVRVNPLTTDELTNFEKGKPFSVAAERTLKRGARRNLSRYKLRRKNLIDALQKAGIITKDAVLAENGKETTRSTLYHRAKAATEKVEKEDLARIFLAINKKRGYKSSRKAKNEEEGNLIDGMAVAKELYDKNLTPGQYAYRILREGRKFLPDFYRSDLQAEFDAVWKFQLKFYPDILTSVLYDELKGKGKKQTWAICQNTFDLVGIKRNTKGFELKVENYLWRSIAISEKLDLEQLAIVLQEINNEINNSSGYLGAISDRSKELFFDNLTVGQYLYKQLEQNPHTSLKNQVFYRQDYLDEFEKIWEVQSKFHTELTTELKKEIRDIIIFYQRKLKSQKGLVSFCEFESKEVIINGKKKTIGAKVAPKSSLLFQEFKIWQQLNNVEIRKKDKKNKSKSSDEENTRFVLDLETKKRLFEELNIKGNLKASKVIQFLGLKPTEWEMNYTELEGNRTQKSLYDAYLKILEFEGYDEKWTKPQGKDNIDVSELNMPASEIKDMVWKIFETLNINMEILEFNAELDGKVFEQQASYRLWHLLYSYEGDDSKTGNEKLYELLEQKFGFKREHAVILANIALPDDYGSLSSKAIRKIFPHIREHTYDKAAALAGYRHSAASLTVEEINNRVLKDKLELLKKNSLRNPVVEKILNQLVNLINTLIEKNSEKDQNGNILKYFKFDEIRIELARELKKNAKERAEMVSNISAAKVENEKVNKILQTEFGVKNPTRNDIIRYRLYEELKSNGYKDFYTNTYIPREILFSSEVDIEHIIPQSRFFDDSFSNKTIVYRRVNLKKGNQTAFDFIESEYGNEKLEDFKTRIESLYQMGVKNKNEGISKAKYQKLLKRGNEIGEGFIERDLRDSQFIAKKARQLLYDVCRVVTPTTGAVTDRLREDWGLVNIMQELNFDKFKSLGLTEIIEKKDGTFKERIKDWSKRNDHRHHAMDALTIAFTKHSHIQYLNYLNARKDEKHKYHHNIIGIEGAETEIVIDEKSGNKKRAFKLPVPNFRQQAKEHLKNVLISYKTKNKVVTRNRNKIKTKNGEIVKIELTPRGQLHKETIYGKYSYYLSKEEKIGPKFDEEMIAKVTNPKYRELLFQRLTKYGNDPKKAFGGNNSLAKNKIYFDEDKTKFIPETVKINWLETDYSIRKDINPENFKDEKSIGKVIDEKIRKILIDRFYEFGKDAKKAFSDLENNPIWLNESKGISIKRVKISGIKNAEFLHYKKDHFGKEILDKNGQKIPTSFVSTGNNHHVAIYRDEKGNLQERVVSFFEAVKLANAGEPIVDKTFNQGLGWQFLFTMKQNEMFVFPDEKNGFDPLEINLLDPKNKKLISPFLYRVQKLASGDYWFRHHLETNVEVKTELKDIAYKRCSLVGIKGIVKVRLNHLGDIIGVGEY